MPVWRYPTIGLVRSTISPSSSSMRRSTPWVDGCCGPMLMIIVSSSDGSSPLKVAASASDMRRVAPTSRITSAASAEVRLVISCAPSEVARRRREELRSAGIAGLLELDRDATDGLALAQRVPDPVLGHEDACEVGVALEADAEHVVHLALHRLGAGVDLEQRRAGGVVFRHLDPEPQDRKSVV